ncbi:hypothetical protein B0H15DRAFT_860367 [Mycena belliarum]|uniref:Uncharacterized protein n=1 Tax=Mycena belliarum TaxID=1033014 RepID=A0AAD6TUT3_9AGAR|nr:hypothetical protein B0H15DRAFT_860367 [Mycena belliae]
MTLLASEPPVASALAQAPSCCSCLTPFVEHDCVRRRVAEDCTQPPSHRRARPSPPSEPCASPGRAPPRRSTSIRPLATNLFALRKIVCVTSIQSQRASRVIAPSPARRPCCRHSTGCIRTAVASRRRCPCVSSRPSLRYVSGPCRPPCCANSSRRARVTPRPSRDLSALFLSHSGTTCPVCFAYGAVRLD